MINWEFKIQYILSEVGWLHSFRNFSILKSELWQLALPLSPRLSSCLPTQRTLFYGYFAWSVTINEFPECPLSFSF